MGKTVQVIENICNITERLHEYGCSYFDSLGGYAINTESKNHFVIAKKSDEEAVFVKTKGDAFICSSVKKNVKHANDCAFYDGKFYVALGKQKKASTIIQCYGADMKYIGQYSYYARPLPFGKELTNITGIDHVMGKIFIMGSENNYSLCYLNENDRQFFEVSRVVIDPSSATNRTERKKYKRQGQGIYTDGEKMFKVYSYNTEGNHTKRNDIVEFKLPGYSPSYNGNTSVSNYYACDRTEKNTFEIEGISSPDKNSSNLYMSANVTESSGKQADAIYHIRLNS